MAKSGAKAPAVPLHQRWAPCGHCHERSHGAKSPGPSNITGNIWKNLPSGPSGNLTQLWKDPPSSTVNPLFLWPFSIAMLNYQRLKDVDWLTIVKLWGCPKMGTKWSKWVGTPLHPVAMDDHDLVLKPTGLETYGPMVIPKFKKPLKVGKTIRTRAFHMCFTMF